MVGVGFSWTGQGQLLLLIKWQLIQLGYYSKEERADKRVLCNSQWQAIGVIVLYSKQKNGYAVSNHCLKFFIWLVTKDLKYDIFERNIKGSPVMEKMLIVVFQASYNKIRGF